MSPFFNYCGYIVHKSNSNMENNIIDYDILIKRICEQLSDEEENTFQKWYTANAEHKAYYESMVREWNNPTMPNCEEKLLLQKYKKVEMIINSSEKTRRVPQIIRWSIAAIFTIAICTYVYTLTRNNQEIRITTDEPQEILPGSSKAYLTLDNGTCMELDNITEDILHGSTRISNRGSSVVFYDSTLILNEENQIKYNTLTVPRNAEYHITLSDNSEVWLNADSKLEFPTRFNNKERKVTISGEAYFKISPNIDSPFIVETDMGNIKVYGTEFSIRRYNDEQIITTTLISGSVGYQKSDNSNSAYIIISPGEQISYSPDSDISIKKVNISNEVAWRYNLFNYEKSPLSRILNDFSRWYDVEFTYENDEIKSQLFTCSLDRYDKIEKLLRFFEEVYNIKFIINGRSITVINK